MTAADDYPLLADFASRPSGHVATLNTKRREARAALDEIERLRTQLDSAYQVGWEAGVAYAESRDKDQR